MNVSQKRARRLSLVKPSNRPTLPLREPWRVLCISGCKTTVDRYRNDSEWICQRCRDSGWTEMDGKP